MAFLAIGAVSAVDSINVSNSEDSNLIGDNDDSLSAQNKLEISSEYSISKTNIVNSQDDNLGNSLDDNNLSYYEDNNQQSTSNTGMISDDKLGQSSSSDDAVGAEVSSTDEVIAAGTTNNNIMTANPVSTVLSVSDTHYAKSATYFDVTLTDNDGKGIASQIVSLTVKGKTYTATTNDNGVASIITDSLTVGTYTVSLSYGGNSNYSSSSLSKKVKVLSSLSGSDLTKYYGSASHYKVTFWKGSSVLANAKVSFKVNGKTYTAKTNSKGVAKLNVNLGIGKYTVTAVNPFSKQKITNKLVVKKDKTTLKPKSSKTYVFKNHKGSFTVTLKSKYGALLKNKEIKFTYNNHTVTKKTNSKGKASITIPVLAEGTYSISYKYNGNKNLYSDSGKSKIVVRSATTKVTSSTLIMKHGVKSKFNVKLTTVSGKALPNKKVKINVHGKTYVKTTNKNGYAKLAIKNLKPGLYKVKYSHASPGSKDYSHGSGKLIVVRDTAVISGENLVMNKGDGSTYQVTVKDKSGNLLSGVIVKSTINGQSYVYKSDENGVAKLKITQGVGYYKIRTIASDPCYKSNEVTNRVLVNGTKFIANDMLVSVDDNETYSLKLVDGKNNPITDAEVNFTFNGKNYQSTTDSKGVAEINLGVLSKGEFKLNYEHGSYSGSSKIKVVNKVTVKDILKASKNVYKYISKKAKLPSTVKIGDVTFTRAQYLYLASKALVNINAGDNSDIKVKDVKNPTNPKAAKKLGKLSKYLAVAKNIVKYAESKGIMPNAVSSQVGTIGYNGLVAIFSNVLSYYGDHGKLPSYVKVKKLSGYKSSSTPQKNNPELRKYLVSSKNCQVNHNAFKKIVAKITKGCKTDRQKANAIFKYVRDTTSYSFYYNTRHGALGTLTGKSGNCVDHAHLLVAMFRTAGLAARYVHGKCTFSSGNTYGHVWAQVYVKNSWVTADATSSRNSLGKIVNWNTNSYTFQGYYISLPF